MNDHVSEEQATINPSEASHYDLMIEENADGDGFKVGKYDSGSDSQEMNPKKRARLGQEKTKWDRMSLGQKAKRISTDQLCKLSEVLMVLTMALGSWTQEVVWQTCTPSSPPNMTISHPGNSENFGKHSVDCLEIFAGHCKISGAFADKRRGVPQPRELLLGDLRCVADRCLPRHLRAPSKDDLDGTPLHQLARFFQSEHRPTRASTSSEQGEEVD